MTDHLSVFQVEALLLEMQDVEAGLKTHTQRLMITTIPHAITGHDILEWLIQRLQIGDEEGQHLGNLMVKCGYIYPLQEPSNLVLKPDTSLYRFQVWGCTRGVCGEDGAQDRGKGVMMECWVRGEGEGGDE
ncbi:PREDICTED: regulator of G-protein signaling 9-like, partial [Nanorana parkeri]|uniref:regulator of G-protein signaling 9-like n=1 Tax=Nanorana parkeri TaxID=125878 RepID=UPI0008540280